MIIKLKELKSIFSYVYSILCIKINLKREKHVYELKHGVFYCKKANRTIRLKLIKHQVLILNNELQIICDL